MALALELVLALVLVVPWRRKPAPAG